MEIHLGEEDREETVPKTPPSNAQPLPLLPPPPPQASVPAQQITSFISKGSSAILNSTTPTHHDITTALIPAEEKLKGVQMQTFPPLAKKDKSARQSIKIGPAKKPRRYNPYDIPAGHQGVFDDSLLMDTPIVMATKDNIRASVAGPQQPPVQR